MELSEKEQWQLQHGRPVPARITWALDSRGLEGPSVDERVGTWEGNPAGDVDDWEAARAVPRPEQVLLLAELTHYPVGFFYLPVAPGPVLGGGLWISWRGRRGCEYVTDDYVDDRGVLLRGGEEPAPPADVQLGLFPTTGVADDAEQRAPRPAAPSRRTPPRKAARPRPADPPALLPPSRMPEHLRAELQATLAANKQGRARR